RGAELVIHNADFDIEFINHELRLLGAEVRDVRECCTVLDTLALARRLHPGQRNSLDALAKRYDVDTSMRELHGALLDAQILADIYLAMTGGQVSLLLDTESDEQGAEVALAVRVAREGLVLPVLAASAAEAAAHEAFLARMREKCGGETVWDRVASAPAERGAAPEQAETRPGDGARAPAASGAARPASADVRRGDTSAAPASGAASLGRPGDPALVPA